MHVALEASVMLCNKETTRVVHLKHVIYQLDFNEKEKPVCLPNAFGCRTLFFFVLFCFRTCVSNSDFQFGELLM